MPDDVRDAFKKAMDTQANPGQNIHSSVMHSKIIFNGTEYENIDAMPPDIRQLYEKALGVAEGGIGSSLADVPGLGDEMLRKAHVSESFGLENIRQATKFESSSPRALIAGAVLLAVIVLLYFLFR
jgi:hypothetical protein